MPKIPVSSLSRQEIVWLSNHKCVHNHNFLEHYNCYVKQNFSHEKIGFLDIESSNLVANFGIMLSYCILDNDTGKILEGVITKKDLQNNPPDKTDKRIVKKCIEDMMKFDRVVTHYGARFDIPFIRTRALINDLEFPQFGALFHTDLWIISKNKLKLNSNRQETIARTLLGNTEKTHLEYKYWIGGVRGDAKSLNYILDHNRKDVRDLQKNYHKMIPFVRKTKTSI